MPLLSSKEVLKLKLESIKEEHLKELASLLNITARGNLGRIIEQIVESRPNEELIEKFIKEKYQEKVANRRAIISDEELKKELTKVQTFNWGVIQGQLDQKIQKEYVRKIVRYEDLINSVRANLYPDITNYVICTWFNHWTTVLIEEHIALHPKVVPTLKAKKGIDIFFCGQPFDLKVTYLPNNYNVNDAIINPLNLAKWLYEHQGQERFGADNRLFVILLDKDFPERSWELKRNFDLIFQRIDNFFSKETISEKDEITFTYKRKVYTVVTKVLLILK